MEFHGYLRTQVGTTSEGGNLQCFGGDGVWPIRSKYRLGNECDTYGEAMVVAPFGKSDGAWAKYNLMLALQEKNAGDYEDVQSGAFNVASRQNFVQAGGFFGDSGALSDAKVWLGKRYYNRHDIHINDYFYWNNSGPGAGLEDINAGPLKLAFAYHQTGGNNDNFSLAFEAGYDAGKTDSGVKPKIAKLTIAPQIALAKGFWARPVFRAFATYAKWNDDARTQAGGGSTSIGPNGVFGDKRNGMNYGLQVETWW